MRQLLIAALAAVASFAATNGENYNIHLWEPGQVPGAKGDGPLDGPFLTVFEPPENKRNGSAVIIAPGGSNIMLMYGVEGLEIAERFNDWGTTAFVLTYRLSPRYSEADRSADGNRAIRLVRARAAEWKIDPKRVLFGGFSAGGHMARSVTSDATPGDPNAKDPVERQPSKADFLLMVYGAGRPATKDNLKEFPPTFLLSAAWDRGAAAGTVQLFQDINRAGGVAELHIYQKGRHGFGAATTSPEYGPWMESLRHFLQLGGFFGAAKK